MITIKNESTTKVSVIIGDFSMSYYSDGTICALLADGKELVNSEEIKFSDIPDALKKLAEIIETLQKKT